MQVAVMGFGTVGSGVVELILKNKKSTRKGAFILVINIFFIYTIIKYICYGIIKIGLLCIIL